MNLQALCETGLFISGDFWNTLDFKYVIHEVILSNILGNVKDSHNSIKVYTMGTNSVCLAGIISI